METADLEKQDGHFPQWCFGAAILPLFLGYFCHCFYHGAASFGSCASSSCKCQPSAENPLTGSNCTGCPAGTRHLAQCKSCQLLWELSVCPSFPPVKRNGGGVWVEQGGLHGAVGERQIMVPPPCSGRCHLSFLCSHPSVTWRGSHLPVSCKAIQDL